MDAVTATATMLFSRSLFPQSPPEPRTRMQNWPTVLYSWWCTSFATAFILVRLSGRKTRSGRFFREDFIMMASLVPLWVRMSLIHFVLVYGTNNVATVGHTFTDTELHNRAVGSKLVLAARIFFAMFIWLCKLTVSEFLKRITLQIWRPSYEIVLMGIRVFLGLTFIAVIIATLSGCEPFDHFWQVVPDPGPTCRQGYNQLLTMGICDIVTDLALIAFPIPIILNSGQALSVKLRMGAVFSLSLIMVAVTATRVPEVILHHGRQQYRTVWASSEILASAITANAVILGSFLRDKGTKKNKYRAHSVTDSVDRTMSRRPTNATLHNMESDEDLFRALGFSIPAHLQDPVTTTSRPAPPASAPSGSLKHLPHVGPEERRPEERRSESDDSMRKKLVNPLLPSPSPSTSKSVSFFDVGNLLDENTPPASTRSRATTIAESGIIAQDFATPSPDHSRRSSRNLHHDAASFSPPSSGRSDVRSSFSSGHRPVEIALGFGRPSRTPVGMLGPMIERQETANPLQDAGGLLRGPGEEIEMAERPARTSPRVKRFSPRSRNRNLVFQDVGGLLEGDRPPDASTAALQRALARHASPGPSSSTAVMPAPRPSVSSGPDDLVLYDVGGLTR